MTVKELHEQFEYAIQLLKEDPNYQKMMKEFWNRSDIIEAIKRVREKLIHKYYNV